MEGIWQGLKVFESDDVDIDKFKIQNMRGIKRTVRKHGTILGHRKGIEGSELLPYKEARKLIYIPSYNYILDNFLSMEINALKDILKSRDLVLLDYETNTDIENLKKPLSHASLVALRLNE